MPFKFFDSFHKLVGYMEQVACGPFMHGGKLRTPPERLFVSWKVFREVTCPAGCAGCCQKFTLDYFEGPRLEELRRTYGHLLVEGPYDRTMPLTQRLVSVNGRDAVINSYMQEDNPGVWCTNVVKSFCAIHKANPFTCEFETRKFVRGTSKALLTNKVFGRGWNMRTFNGGRGALCIIQPKPDMGPGALRTVELVRELGSMCDVFGIEHRCELLATTLEAMLPMAEKSRELLISGRPVEVI